MLALWNAFPVTPGHALLIPKRHVEDWSEATPEEQLELTSAIQLVRNIIVDKHQPDGFNIGMNLGRAAGQTVPHLHLHVLPRYHHTPPLPDQPTRFLMPSEPVQQLTTGEASDPFFKVLLPWLDRARQVDIAVAFIQPSGLDLVEPVLRTMLSLPEPTRLRVVTGDTLGVTDPDALARLLDLMDSYPERADIRIFQSAGQSFHPKAYRIVDFEGTETSFVGSSNLTGSALRDGVEWNYRLIPFHDRNGLRQVAEAFENLLQHPKTRPLTQEWIEAYRQRRSPLVLGGASLVADLVEAEPVLPVHPHEVQLEALQALRATRQEGNRAGLVVLATGLGKTFLAAFDSQPFRRILFVAHRDEILHQARDTFRKVRPGANLGLYTGTQKDRNADILFSSVQTLSREAHLRRFARDAFDYIVVDEFHHAHASTYRRIIEYFQPQFMLGLTATPERTDGGDLLSLCLENLVYRCDLLEGIRRELLAPFHYFGVPDTVDYRQVRWRGGRFDPTDLERVLSVETRAAHALEQYRLHAGRRTLVFCSSQSHADFMDDYLRRNGVRSASIHSGPTSAPRSGSLEQLRTGELEVLCCVDMFNEGLDVPAIDTVMMLRPTESRIVWLQQFGRGLRKTDAKPHLTVIDYIGNHRVFLNRPEMLLGLNGLDRAALLRAMDQLRDEVSLPLPPGCAIHFDMQAIELLESLLRRDKDKDVFLAWYQDFKHLRGRRPTAGEAFHSGYNPRVARQRNGSWLGFVRAQGDFHADEEVAWREASDFLVHLETTAMSKSYNVVLLQAMLNLGQLPGAVPVPDLAAEFASVVSRSARLQAEIPVHWRDDKALEQWLRSHPLHDWLQGEQHFFALQEDQFVCRVVPPSAMLKELTAEILEWRLADYLAAAREGVILKVAQANKRPILFLPPRGTPDVLPSGPTTVKIDGTEFEATFAKIAVNVVRPPGGGENVLPRILRGWFGPDAGQPGTMHRVELRRDGDGWALVPVGALAGAAVVGQTYAREQIPGLFGLEFNTAIWNTGFVKSEKHVFLLVTLNKAGVPANYDDRFLSDELFQWQSQNRTKPDDKDGRLIRGHQALGVKVHLFVREHKRASGFKYFGEVDFVSSQGSEPMTVVWRLHRLVTSQFPNRDN